MLLKIAAIQFIVMIILLYGWVENIINIIHSDLTHITGLLIVQIIGVFVAPVGGIMGLFF